MGGQVNRRVGRRAFTQRGLLKSRENQASGISPPQHTSPLSAIIGGVGEAGWQHRALVDRKQHNVAPESTALASPGSGGHSSSTIN